MGRSIQNAQQFEDFVAKEIERGAMLPFGARVGAGVSGGADSVALLLVLDALRGSHSWDLRVLHLNHGLRGICSDEDEAFVRQLAERLGLPFEVRRLPPASAPTTAVEEWARNERLAFYRWAITESGMDRIATGHHRGDQAETVLFRLLRGAGSRGLGGMQPITAWGMVRPLLSLSREDIRAYLSWRKQEWREDASNLNQDYRRNALRHHWMPALSHTWNPALESALANTAVQLRDESALLGDLATEAASKIFLPSPFGWEGRASAFVALPVALQRRIILDIHRPHGPVLKPAEDANKLWQPSTALGFEAIETIREMWTAPRRSGRYLVRDLLFERSLGLIRIAAREVLAREAALANLANQQTLSVVARQDGYYPLRGCSMIAELAYVAGSQSDTRLASKKSGYTGSWSFLEFNRLCYPLTLRQWREGDEFHQIGCASKIKFKRLFHRHGVPKWRRRDEMILESAGEVVWSSSFGPAAGFVVPANTMECLAVRVIPSDKEWESSLANAAS